MEQRDYTNGELGIMLEGIKENMVEMKTLFVRVNSLENWRWYIAGIVTFFMFIVFPLGLAIIKYM